MIQSTTTFTLRVPSPLRMMHGEFRVGNTRVCLGVVIREFLAGAEPQAILDAYPSLGMADVYGAIAYFAARREEAERLRQEIEAAQPSGAELREKLRARWAEKHPGERSQ